MDERWNYLGFTAIAGGRKREKPRIIQGDPVGEQKSWPLDPIIMGYGLERSIRAPHALVLFVALTFALHGQVKTPEKIRSSYEVHGINSINPLCIPTAMRYFLAEHARSCPPHSMGNSRQFGVEHQRAPFTYLHLRCHSPTGVLAAVDHRLGPLCLPGVVLGDIHWHIRSDWGQTQSHVAVGDGAHLRRYRSHARRFVEGAALQETRGG